MTKEVKIRTRELFDVRYQLLQSQTCAQASDSKEGQAQESEQIDVTSDLIPGIYEGGFKTWEAAADLVRHLASSDLPNALVNSFKNTDNPKQRIHICELGCGTALPSLFCLQSLLVHSSLSAPVTLHLQDYNDQVLRSVRFGFLPMGNLAHRTCRSHYRICFWHGMHLVAATKQRTKQRKKRERGKRRKET